MISSLGQIPPHFSKDTVLQKFGVLPKKSLYHHKDKKFAKVAVFEKYPFFYLRTLIPKSTRPNRKKSLYHHKDKKLVKYVVWRKSFWETKKDRDRRQRTNDLSSILPDSHGHPVFRRIFHSRRGAPDYFRGTIPTVSKISPWYEAEPRLVCAFILPHSPALFNKSCRS